MPNKSDESDCTSKIKDIFESFQFKFLRYPNDFIMNHPKTSLKLTIFLIFSSTIFIVYVNVHTLAKLKVNLVKKQVFVKEYDKLRKLEDYAPINKNNYPIVTNYKLKDWVDHEFVEYEKSREGPGEQGAGVKLTDPEDIKKNEEIAKIEGLNALVSDKISVNRSVYDSRPESCRELKYLEHLPKVSIIVIFHNEYQSILYRSLHSIYNRTPREVN